MTRTASLLAFAAAFAIAHLVTGAVAQEAVSVQLTIKDHRFQPAEIRVPAGKPVNLQVKNLDPTPEEFESKTLRVEKVIAGNSEATIRLRALDRGRYKFFGEFNEATAQGVLAAE
jgi:plastocyanin